MIDLIVALPVLPTLISVFSALKESPIMGIDIVVVRYLFWPSMALFVAFSLFLITARGIKWPFFSGMTPHLFNLATNSSFVLPSAAPNPF